MQSKWEKLAFNAQTQLVLSKIWYQHSTVKPVYNYKLIVLSNNKMDHVPCVQQVIYNHKVVHQLLVFQLQVNKPVSFIMVIKVYA